MDRQPPPFAVDIISDDDSAAHSPSPARPKKRQDRRGGGGGSGSGSGGEPPPSIFVIDDDPTPQKSNPTRTPSFVAETPLSSGLAFRSDVSIVRCSLARAADPGVRPPPLPEKFSGITGLIYLESDNESGDGSHETSSKKLGIVSAMTADTEMCSSFSRPTSPMGAGYERNCVQICSPIKQAMTTNDKNDEVYPESSKYCPFDDGTSDLKQITGESPHGDLLPEDAISQLRNFHDEQHHMAREVDSPIKRKGRSATADAEKNKWKNEEAARKKQLKEEKNRLNEERKRKRQEDKLQKEALKAEAAEAKKQEKEKLKWEKGKSALKSIVVEIDAKIVENGSVGGHLLSRFAEKGFSYRITTNPVEMSILWKLKVPDQIAQVSSVREEVPYVLLVFQAEEFCNLVNCESFIEHVHRVRGQYPSFTICYLTNRLMSYINKCEQHQYKNPSNGMSWRRPPVEEVLSKLTTHFDKVHSRQCIDEAELAEHIVGLTSSLANCQFRKKLTWLSVNANGSIIPKDFIDKNIIKRTPWLKALIAIPKVQPRHAIAIWKKFPTMRSLLNVYMDPNRSVHEKEFLLKDLMIEGLLGKEERRLGEVCSKRVYRVLMAQSGGIKTDEVEDGADFFECS